jgi:hypothetical protein
MAEPISKKIVLVDQDIGREQQDWFNVRASVWGHKFYTYKETYHALGQGNLGYGPLGGSNTSESGNKNYPTAIGAVTGDAVSFTEQASLASVQANVQSYWYDYDSSTIYVNSADFNEPDIYTIVLGLTLALSNHAIHINNVYYEPKVRGVPVLTKTKDPLFFGLIKHDGGSIEYDNHDGFFDNITDDYIFGQQTIIRYGGDYHNKVMPFANYRKVFTGYIDACSTDWETFTTEIVHKIKRLGRTIPERKYNTTDFPNLNVKDVGKPRPIAYGPITGAEVVCTNKDAGSGPWIFECADTNDHASGILSVTTIYKNGESIAIDSQSVAGGTFNVADANYKPTATDRGAIWTADFSGYAEADVMITNACDVMKDIASVYASITYNSTNYDDTEWDAEDDDALNCTLFINKEQEIADIFQKLCLSSFGVFIEKDDGRYTFRIVDTSASASETISKNKIIGSPGVSHEGALFVSSCKVGYGKQWKDNTYSWLLENTDETDLATKYGRRSERTFETLLTNATDAQTLATRIMNYYGTIGPEITIRVPIEYVDFEIGDIKSIDTDRKNTTFMGTIKTEIISITKNIGLKDEPDFLELTGRKIG